MYDPEIKALYDMVVSFLEPEGFMSSWVCHADTIDGPTHYYRIFDIFVVGKFCNMKGEDDYWLSFSPKVVIDREASDGCRERIHFGKTFRTKKEYEDFLWTKDYETFKWLVPYESIKLDEIPAIEDESIVNITRYKPQ